MTGRNEDTGTRETYAPLGIAQRLLLPMLFLGSTIAVAGCLQPTSVSQASSARRTASTRSGEDTETTMPADLAYAVPNQDTAVAGQSNDVAVSSVQVLPAGDVTAKRIDLKPNAVVPTTITRWVKNRSATTLWSSANADGTAFTDLPAGSFMRVVGPEDRGRLAVYYVGDGMLRRAGNGWVEAKAVDTVDAPAPGQVPAVDADASQPLPLWVQAHRATTLWSGPDDKAVPLTDLGQWTFLKVAGLERSGRLLVNFAGDYSSRQSGIGWVDGASVGPAGDPGRWVTNHRASPLWSGVDDKAQRFTDLPQWTKLRIVEGAPPDTGRMQVEFFGDGATRLPGTGWIARADIGPITPPVPLPLPVVISNKTRALQMEAYSFASGTDFINAVGAAAQRSRKATGVPASVTVAQAILESDWGRSRLARQGNNLFGIKALGSVTGPAGVVSIATWEHINGSDVVVQAPFKAYYTLEQSIDDHGTFFTRNRRYAAALSVAGDARAFAQAIQDAGYATDPNYASKLIGLMDRYNLYRFDS